MKTTGATIVWFRQDFRLDDNPAWAAAIARGMPALPLYIHAPEEEGSWPPGAASRWWLHHALEDLADSLRASGLRLTLRRGRSGDVLTELVRESGARAVYWNRRYEPAIRERDREVAEHLRVAGIEARSFNSALLFEPWKIRTGSGSPYRVFTPFSRAAVSLGYPRPVRVGERKAIPPDRWPKSFATSDLGLLPKAGWDSGLRRAWTPTRAGALGRLDSFLAGGLRDYSVDRDFPGEEAVSRLSPYLHFGQVGPREVVARAARRKSSQGRDSFIRELLWREFAYHVLYHFPASPETPLRDGFRKFPWRESGTDLQSWRRGRTGYPLVDAGMRQLWETGWMHNRVRMVAASFLVKHLLLPWQEGARWFWDTLVDADLANNTLGWQWVAGCGADAAPFFRVFNPTAQGEKFDPGGAFVRRYVPELAALPDSVIHCPWKASRAILEDAGVRLGENYPHAIVDHGEGRNRALAAFRSL